MAPFDPPAAPSPPAALSAGIGPSPGIGVPRAEAHPQRNTRRAAAIAALLAVGLGGLGGGGYGLFHEFTRGPTRAELTRASDAEQAQRWQALPVGKIFPAVIPYTTDTIFNTTRAGTTGTTEQAHLVGVLPASGCPSALDPVAARALGAHGCRSMLRATYADPSGTVLVTIGVAVMPSAAAAGSASGALPPGHGVLPAGLAGTIASSFGGNKHLTYDSASGAGPYLVIAALGYADGRAASEMPDALPDFALTMETRVVNTLDASIPPCRAKDVRC